MVNETSESAVNPHIDALGRVYATGRRKTSVARVWIKEGSGQFLVNDKNVADFFQPLQRSAVLEPFLVSETGGLFDVLSTVKGGGMSGESIMKSLPTHSFPSNLMMFCLFASIIRPSRRDKIRTEQSFTKV